MKLSEKSCAHIDACRFCWMCRHICPIGNATGQERNTSRARALSLSLVNREGADFSDDVVDNVYECALCGACTKECVTGWDPVLFTKEARLKAALEGKTPAYVSRLLDCVFETGNIYGKTETDGMLTAAIRSLGNSKTLLYLGADARYLTPEISLRAIELLRLAKVDFTVLEQEPDSGFALDFLIGAAEETRAAVLNTAAALSEYETVICLDPQDMKMFIREYKEWNAGLTAEIVSLPAYLLRLIQSGALKPAPSALTAVFQDPALLAREVGETEPEREVLRACLSLSEMLLNRKDTMLAGHSIMDTYMPQVMDQVAARRWHEALECGVQALVTASPAEYAVMGRNKPEQMQLLSLEEAVLAACK